MNIICFYRNVFYFHLFKHESLSSKIFFQFELPVASEICFFLIRRKGNTFYRDNPNFFAKNILIFG